MDLTLPLQETGEEEEQQTMPHSIGRIMPRLTGVLLSPHCSMPLLRKMVRLLVTTIMEVPITGKCPKTGSVLQAQAVMFLTGCHVSLLKTYWSRTLTGCPPPRPCPSPLFP